MPIMHLSQCIPSVLYISRDFYINAVRHISPQKMFKSEKLNDKFSSLLQVAFILGSIQYLAVQSDATNYVSFVLHALSMKVHVKTCYWQCVGMRLVDPTPFSSPDPCFGGRPRFNGAGLTCSLD